MIMMAKDMAILEIFQEAPITPLHGLPHTPIVLIVDQQRVIDDLEVNWLLFQKQIYGMIQIMKDTRQSTENYIEG